jgi:phage portal protein BeeE
VRFETDALLRSDAKTRAEVYEKALDPLTGWMTRAEVRRLEDLEPEQAGAPALVDAISAITSPGEVTANGNQA